MTIPLISTRRALRLIRDQLRNRPVLRSDGSQSPWIRTRMTDESMDIASYAGIDIANRPDWDGFLCGVGAWRHAETWNTVAGPWRTL